MGSRYKSKVGMHLACCNDFCALYLGAPLFLFCIMLDKSKFLRSLLCMYTMTERIMQCTCSVVTSSVDILFNNFLMMGQRIHHYLYTVLNELTIENERQLRASGCSGCALLFQVPIEIGNGVKRFCPRFNVYFSTVP